MLLQSRLTLCDPMECSPPGSSVHGISHIGVGRHFFLQGIFLTWGWNPVSLTSPALVGEFFTTSATWGAQIFTEDICKDLN